MGGKPSAGTTKDINQVKIVQDGKTIFQLLGQTTNVNPTPDAFSAFEESQAKGKNNPYTIENGYLQDEPIIVLSTEFLPLSSNDRAYVLNASFGYPTPPESDRDYSLTVKSNAEILTAKSAMNFFDKKNTVKTYCTNEITSLKTFASDTKSKAYDLIMKLSWAEDALNLSKKYIVINTKQQLGIQSNEYADILGSNEAQAKYGFGDFLIESGWDRKIFDGKNQISPTSLYQQYLLELKRLLLTHSPKLVTFLGESFLGSSTRLTIPIGPENSYRVHGLFNINRSLNNYGKLDPIQSSILEKYGLFGNHYFFTRKILPRHKTLNLQAIAQLKGSQLAYALTNPLAALGAEIFGGAEFLKYFNTDWSFSSELVAKEILFSRALGNPELRQELSRLGYVVNSSGNDAGSDNFNVWDTIIGKNFVENVLDLPADETSLLGLSRSIDGVSSILDTSNVYKILTFETFDVLFPPENLLQGPPPTQGPFYYIDGSLRVSAGNRNKFDLTRLNNLIAKFNDSLARVDAIKRFYTGGVKTERLRPLHEYTVIGTSLSESASSTSVSSDPIYKIVNKFKFLSDLYVSHLRPSMKSASDVCELKTGERAQMLDSPSTKDPGYLPVKDEAKSIATASIFKLAYERWTDKQPNIMLALYQLILRETYTRLVKQGVPGIGLQTSYDAFKSDFKAPTKKTKSVNFDSDAEVDATVTWYTEASDADVVFKEKKPPKQLLDYPGDTNLARTGWTDMLLEQGKANTPELVLDALLYRDQGQMRLAESPSARERNYKNLQGSGVYYLPIQTYNNIGYVEIAKGYEDYLGWGEINQVLALTEMSAAEWNELSGAEKEKVKEQAHKKFINWIEDYGSDMTVDTVTLGDDPVFRAIFLGGYTFIKNLDTGLNGKLNAVFTAIVDLMSDLFVDNIYRETSLTNDANTKTLYGLHEKSTIVFSYFLTICKMISASTIDKFGGFWVQSDPVQREVLNAETGAEKPIYFSFSNVDNYEDGIGNVGNANRTLNIGGYRLIADNAGLKNYDTEVTDTPITYSKPYLVDKTISPFDPIVQTVSAISFSVNKKPRPRSLIDAVKPYNREIMEVSNRVHLLETTVNNALTKLTDLRNYLSGDFVNYLNQLNSVLDAEEGINDEQRKVELVNLSLDRNQLKLLHHGCDEVLTRYDAGKSEAAFRESAPFLFADLNEGFGNYLPLDDLNFLPYITGIRNLFVNSKTTNAKEGEFSAFKGNNKRILSVGLPPRLLQFVSKDQSLDIVENENKPNKFLIKIDVTRKDLLYPGITFQPMTFVFDTSMFSTKASSNWKIFLKKTYENLLSGPASSSATTDFLDAPVKVIRFNRPEPARSYANFSEFSSNTNLGNILPSPASSGYNTSLNFYKNIYRNHAMSNALEVYMNWFTSLKINELDFYNYVDLKMSSRSVENQFKNYLNLTNNKFDATNVFGEVIPTNYSESDLNKIVSNAENSVKSYFKNETIFMGLNEQKRRLLLPKKFDRVFHLLIDPDDFKIQKIEPIELQTYLNKGIIKLDEATNTYVYRQTQQSQFYLDSYDVLVDSLDVPNFENLDFVELGSPELSSEQTYVIVDLPPAQSNATLY